MKGFGEEEGGGECFFVQSEFRGCVFEGSYLALIVAVPAAGREAGFIRADYAGGLPGG